MNPKRTIQLIGCLFVTLVSVASGINLALWELAILCAVWGGLVEYCARSWIQASRPATEAKAISAAPIANGNTDRVSPTLGQSQGAGFWEVTKPVGALFCWVSSCLMVAFAVACFVFPFATRGFDGSDLVDPIFFQICLIYLAGVALAWLAMNLTKSRIVLWIALLPLFVPALVVFALFADGMPLSACLSIMLASPPALIWARLFKLMGGIDSARPALARVLGTPPNTAGQTPLKDAAHRANQTLSSALQVIASRVLSWMLVTGLPVPSSITEAFKQSESGELVLTPLATSRLKVCVFVFAGLFGLWLLWPAGQSSRAAVEQIMQKETQVRSTAKGSAADVVAQMRALDTARCPEDFRVAFLRYIHAWESGAVVAQRNAAFQAESNGLASMAESVVRGYFGDPFGKALEIHAGTTALQQQTAVAQEEIRLARQKVEEIALKYGVSSP
jgi:hypothetical protein